jgi:hypothetical protein
MLENVKMGDNSLLLNYCQFVRRLHFHRHARVVVNAKEGREE